MNKVGRKLLVFTVFAAVLVLWTCPVSADTSGSFSLTNCGTAGTSCPAATYSFNVTGTQATLTITIASNATLTSGSNGNDQLTGVDLGFTPQNNISFLSSTVQVSGTASTNWTGSLGSLNNSNCGNNGGAFVCATGTPITLVQGGTYTFTWNYTTTDDSKVASSPSDVHIGANYGPANGLIVSVNGVGTPVSQVPEPSSMALMGTGLLSLAGVLRRRLGL